MSTDRREALAEVGLRLIAREGLRGLTHRAIDADAGLPMGSTSYYFRTREALLTACVDRLVALDLAELAATGMTDRRMTRPELATLGAQLTWRWLHEDAHRHLARYELLLEARRRPQLRSALLRAGETLRDRMTALLAAQGAQDAERSARWLVACIDGMVFDQLVGAGSARPPSFDDLLVWSQQLITAILGDSQAPTGWEHRRRSTCTITPNPASLTGREHCQ